MLLLMGAGVITAIPLLLFAAGAKRISFTLVGFLQYVAPTIMLILGLFLFHEPFSLPQLLSFILIWIALIIFSLSRSWELLRKKKIEQQARVSENVEARSTRSGVFSFSPSPGRISILALKLK
ncbi:putative chloramphenical resistance permease RarD [Paenibacillus larvae subsp. larvae]|uniref:Putative chloramphenical resistance permease RarD n=1 Tax=Paenibacillus larvae subsp. larvae TaxID=147375 RepID=A0A2L1UBM4_9BACL|nr:putative chloramphenical resistance permease RarD [Paenibacillus larvae subsp. larvae]AVF30330.1 putative chloramphenical resistance permease RarD [Paenibacillus larvae subsp. larvae]